jgi:hypothetical protein
MGFFSYKKARHPSIDSPSRSAAHLVSTFDLQARCHYFLSDFHEHVHYVLQIHHRFPRGGSLCQRPGRLSVHKPLPYYQWRAENYIYSKLISVNPSRSVLSLLVSLTLSFCPLLLTQRHAIPFAEQWDAYSKAISKLKASGAIRSKREPLQFGPFTPGESNHRFRPFVPNRGNIHPVRRAMGCI